MASPTVLDSTAATWLASAAANTLQTVDFSLFTFSIAADAFGRYVLIVDNPSTVTALTITIQDKENINGAVKYAQRDGISWSVPANSTRSFVMDAALTAEGGRVTLSNVTALGAGQGFSAAVKVRVVNNNC